MAAAAATAATSAAAATAATATGLKQLRVGFIGAGKMASALARGFAQTLPQGSKMISASCPVNDAPLLEEMGSMGCTTMHSNKQLVRDNDVILVAVKPGVMPIICKEVKALVTPDKLFVSIAAGVKLQAIQDMLHQEAKAVRVMPNTPSLVGEGATVYSLGDRCSPDTDGKIVSGLFSGVGQECHPVSEAMIDAVTGISGSGPAYMYLIIEAMADAGVKQGLPRELSYRLAAQTMVGAGKMVLETGKHPAVLKDDVCSPAGSTIAALATLEKNGLRNTLMQAVEAATLRCKQLGGGGSK